MKIAGIVKSTLVDYPGVLACTLFVPGCNYNCFYCHNRELLTGEHPVVGEEEVWTFLNRRKSNLEGVVITGGEPTLWPDLIPFIRNVKALGYRVKLDTNGSNPDIMAKVLSEGLIDYAAVDYKAPLSKYREIGGGEADGLLVLQTIDVLTSSGIDFEVRTTVIPQLTKADLMRMAQELPVLSRYVLNRYRPPENYLPEDEHRVKQKPYTPEEIGELSRFIRSIQPNVRT